MLNHADVIGDQSDAMTQNPRFRCALCAAISEEISILIQTGAESWGRFPVPRICRWESRLPIEFHSFTSRINSKSYHSLVPGLISIFTDGMGPFKQVIRFYSHTIEF